LEHKCPFIGLLFNNFIGRLSRTMPGQTAAMAASRYGFIVS